MANQSAAGDGALHLPARTIPVPKSISAEAQAFLAAAAAQPGVPDFPPLSDKAGWKRHIAAMDASMAGQMAALAVGFAGTTQTRTLKGGDGGDIPLYVATPDGRAGRLGEVAYLDIHGGGLIMLGGEPCRLMGIGRARGLGAQVYSVDYRMPPDHPYPTPLDDCLVAYRSLLERYRPTDIVVGGGSAGGNLAGALMLRIRDEGLPLPAGVVLMTPELDLTESGDSFETLLGIDVVLKRRLMDANLLYADGQDLAHPYLSPLFGDFAKGYPPTFLQTGTRDLFLSNTVRMHRALRRAGVPVELHVFEAMPHGGFFGSPESAEMEAEVRRFVHERWGG